MNSPDINSLVECYNKNCKKEVKMRKKIRDKWNINTNKIHNDYKNGIIKSKKEFIKIINKLDSDYFNSIENINMYNCEIDNCYNLLKNKLDYAANKIKYNKKNEKYSIEDYINILTITNKNENNQIK